MRTTTANSDAGRQTDLRDAAASGNIEAVRTLLSLGADANADGGWAAGQRDGAFAEEDSEGATPLYLAAERGHVEVARLLAGTRGCNINQANANGATPLFVAATNSHRDVIAALTKAGSTVSPTFVHVPWQTSRASLRDGTSREAVAKALPWGSNFTVTISGRHAHSGGYVRALADEFGFDVLVNRNVVPRMEHGRQVRGELFVLRLR